MKSKIIDYEKSTNINDILTTFLYEKGNNDIINIIVKYLKKEKIQLPDTGIHMYSFSLYPEIEKIIDNENINDINDILTNLLYQTTNNDIIKIIVKYLKNLDIVNYKPSGSCNFSRIDNVKLNYEPSYFKYIAPKYNYN